MKPLIDTVVSPAGAVDKTVSRPAPARRHVSARYDASITTTENYKHWRWSDSMSAGAAMDPATRQRLRDRARYEVANNSYASGMVRTLANDCIGTGPSLQMLSGDSAADTQVEVAFWQWSKAVRMAEKLRIMRMSMCTDGESFGVFGTNFRLPSEVKLDIRLVEADQVSNSFLNLDPRTSMSDGITYDDFGNPLSYFILKSHPGDSVLMGFPTDGTTVPAENVIHLVKRERPGQLRGVPELTPAINLYAQLRRYTLAVIAAAETAADLAGVLQTQQSPENPDDLEPLDSVEIERRHLMTLPAGWTMSQIKAEQPVTTYAMFKSEIINEIARCLNMPFNVAAGNSAGYNYASGRLDHQVYYKSIRVDRAFIETEALEFIFERWLEEARLIPGYLPESIAASRTTPAHEWRWDGSEHVDPQKEANAQQTKLLNNTTTLAREYARQGLDWEDELDQRAKELKRMKELGLTPEAAAPAPPTAQEEDELEEE